MGYIQRLPFLAGGLAAVIIGTMGYMGGLPQKDTYIRMAIGLAIFYIIGIFIKNTLVQINREVETQKRKKEYERMQSEALSRQDDKSKRSGVQQNAKDLGRKIDYVVKDEEKK